MAITIDATVGGASANSYITLANAKIYFDEILKTYSGVYTDDQISAALIQSTRWLDGKFRWIGEIGSLTQALNWPRFDAYDNQGRSVGDNSIPVGVSRATCEAAWVYLVDGSLESTQKRGNMVQREKVGEIEVEYMSGAPGGNAMPQVISHIRGLFLSNRKATRT